MIWKLGHHQYQIDETELPDKFELRFKYNKELVEEVKCLEGAKFRDKGTEKFWEIPRTDRNLYSLEKLQGIRDHYDTTDFTPYEPPVRKLYQHQKNLIGFGIAKNRCIWAGEMGTGKTLAGIELMEFSKLPWLIVCPTTAKYVWNSEILKWSANIDYRLITYGKLTQWVKLDARLKYFNIFFDEAHALKNYKTQRTQAALRLSSELGGYIILASGTPQPKDPTNWWSLCEICQPGFIREPNVHKFKERLAVLQTNVGMQGQQFKTVSEWKPRELTRLNKQLDRIRIVVLKKDCLDLPDKIYNQIRLPFQEFHRKILKSIINTQGKGIKALQYLRQYSDGFNYKGTCQDCDGTGTNKGTKGYCHKCNATGEVTTEFETPKDKALLEFCSEPETLNNRIVIYAAYRNSIDKVCKLLKDWQIIRIDGRGIEGDLDSFQSDSQEQIAIVGHPESGGQGFTFTKAENIIYYSNDFNAKNRWQSEDRIHRIGTTKAVINDLLWLPTDYYILKNLRNKKDLQSVTLGELTEYVNLPESKFYEHDTVC